LLAPVKIASPQPLAAEGLYGAVLGMLDGQRPGRALDLPAGQGAFAAELLERGFEDLTCLDIAPEAFMLRDPRVRFGRHDAIDPLPFPDAHFDQVFCIEGIEHFHSPWSFMRELCRVLRPGGRLYLTTPNTLSVDARIKYLLSGYFPRFRPLAKEPEKVMHQSVDDAHVSPIYFWQLNFFLMHGGVDIRRVATNAEVRKPRWINRMVEEVLAGVIRRNVQRRGFADKGVSSDAMLFGDCIVIEGVKQ